MEYNPCTASYLRIRQWLQWALVGFCLVATIWRLETPCNSHHKSLNDLQQAMAEFGGHDSQPAKQTQYWDWPEDPDSCAAKVRDINTWAALKPAQGPFQFPKIIHQTVEDKNNISCEVLECMQTWKQRNPEHEHRLYDAKDRLEFVRSNYPELLSVYVALGTNVERADLWRYLALHKHGGVYADSDVRCIKPINTWNALNNHDADLLLGVVYTDSGGMVTRVNNFILAAMPCHPVMAAMPFTALSRIAAAGLAGKAVGGEKGKALSEAVIGRTGPAALTATIADYARRSGTMWPVNGTAGAQGAGLGNLVGTARLMPRSILTMGWETAAEKITCDEALQRNPGAYICHQYFGTWKASYNHRPSLTYSNECRYWGLNHTAAAEEAAVKETPSVLNSWETSSGQKTVSTSKVLGDDESTQHQVEQDMSRTAARQQQQGWDMQWGANSEEEQQQQDDDDGEEGRELDSALANGEDQDDYNDGSGRDYVMDGAYYDADGSGKDYVMDGTLKQ